MRDESVKLTCKICGKTKRVEEFGWSKRRQRPTKTCKKCWTDPRTARVLAGHDSTEELLLYYADIRSLMTEIHKARADTIKDGLPLEREVATSYGEIFMSEMTEEAYRAIIQALKRKAEQGDVKAAEMLLKERQARLGDPSPESVQDAFEELFRADPLTTGLDSE